MKKSIVKITAFLLAFVLFFSYIPSLTVYAMDEGPGKYRVSVSSTLRLRSGPGTSYSTLANIPNGTVLDITETSKGWGKTIYNGYSGWISLDYAHLFADNSGNITLTDQRKDIITIAKGELGYKEGSNNYTKYGVWYSSVTKNAPWCAIFVCWCAYQAGISEGIIPRFSFCYNGITLFKNLNVWHERAGYTPQAGDIIFFRSDEAKSASDHVGIVVSSDAERVYTIEGNSSDAVSERNYLLTDKHIVGYASPNYVPGPTTTSSSTTTTTTTTTTSASDATSSSTTATSATNATASSTTATTTASSTTTATTTPAAPSVTEQIVVNASVVNLREKTSTSSQRLAVVKKGEVFEDFEKVEDSEGNAWYKVESNGIIGYLIGTYIDIEVIEKSNNNSNQTGNQFALITGSVVNVRAGAGTGNAKLGSVTRNTIIAVTGSTSVSDVTWYKVDYNGKTGYISSEYSSIVSEITVNGAVVNIRANPAAEGRVIATVKNGQRYDIIGVGESNDDIWIKININGTEGYINSRFTVIK